MTTPDVPDVVVVDHISLDAAPGEVVGILGPNGAGKTSLFDALCGVLPPSTGTVTLLGFRTQHRGQSVGTFRFLFNALLAPGLHDAPMPR